MPRVDPEKNRAYQRKWYQKNKQLQIKRNKENCKKKYEWYREYKKTLQCQTCGEDHPATLDFHHRNPDEKDRTVYDMVRHNCGMDRILEEVKKCDVLCANCHRKLHYAERWE